MASEKRKPELMTPAEVATAFGVTPKTVTKWSNKRYLTPVMTLGGHRRYIRDEVEALRKQRQRGNAALEG